MANVTLSLEEYQELLDAKEDFEERLTEIEEKIFPQQQENEEEPITDIEDPIIS